MCVGRSDTGWHRAMRGRGSYRAKNSKDWQTGQRQITKIEIWEKRLLCLSFEVLWVMSWRVLKVASVKSIWCSLSKGHDSRRHSLSSDVPWIPRWSSKGGQLHFLNTFWQCLFSRLMSSEWKSISCRYVICWGREAKPGTNPTTCYHWLPPK
jgi:hypothetical protein